VLIHDWHPAINEAKLWDFLFSFATAGKKIIKKVVLYSACINLVEK